ncbi:hypothetical protein, partial [Streptomyces sp. NPDC050704]|uniref:hypothetical protein n=1 Tax=Streptomyces sp. NPDC050704 TaxID=3157219 RepID=UPI00342539DF
ADQVGLDQYVTQRAMGARALGGDPSLRRRLGQVQQQIGVLDGGDGVVDELRSGFVLRAPSRAWGSVTVTLAPSS